MRDTLLSFVGWLLAGYLLLCGLMFLLQRELLYPRSLTRPPARPPNFELPRGEVLLRGWHLQPGRERALLYFGGNAEDLSLNLDDFRDWFPEHTLLLVAYRGYGDSGGRPDEAALKADGLALVDWLVARGHARIDVLGRSLGSGVALHVAARRPLGRLALITPYDSLRAVAAGHYPWLPVRWLLRDPWLAEADAAAVTAPALLLVARHDEVIPPARGLALRSAFPKPPELVLLNTGHNDVEADPGFLPALQAHFSTSATDAGDPQDIAPSPLRSDPEREQPMHDPRPTHLVNGQPLLPPYPAGARKVQFGMGCFWGAERRFWTEPGVIVTAAGYAGGHLADPDYRAVCRGDSGHAEVVLVVYDPERLSFARLLEVFFTSHDPTQGNRQGNDIGSQYRSVIHAGDEEQLAAALAARERYQAALSGAGYGEITTEVRPWQPFHLAEDYHQQYLARNPRGYCGLRGTGVNCTFG